MQIDQGTIELSGRHSHGPEVALKVLCDPSIRLDECAVLNVLDAWTGFTRDDMDQFSAEDRQTFPRERLLSGFTLNHMYLKDPLEKTIAILEEMRYRGA